MDKQESRAVAGKPRDAAVIFQDDGRLPSWIWSNRKLRHSIRRPRKPYTRTKHRITRCVDMAVRISTYHEGCIWDPHFEERKGRIVPLERAMVVFYTLPISQLSPYCTISNHSAATRPSNICGAQFIGGVGYIGSKFWVFPLE